VLVKLCEVDGHGGKVQETIERTKPSMVVFQEVSRSRGFFAGLLWALPALAAAAIS
jgi:hypothetical protein